MKKRAKVTICTGSFSARFRRNNHAKKFSDKIDLHQMLETIAHEVAPHCAEKNITLTLDNCHESIFGNKVLLYRVDPSRTRSLGGSGLGLSIIRSIIEKHKGRIHVKSAYNIGTTFEIELLKN